MARILANITPSHVRAAVAEAAIIAPTMREELERILLGRRELILRRFLSKISPLAAPRIIAGDRGAEICLRDLAIAAGVAPSDSPRPYWTRGYQHVGGSQITVLERGSLVRRGRDRICVSLPNVVDARLEHPAYLIIDLAALDGWHDKEAAPLRIHVYQFGPGRYKLVGLERPDNAAPPNAR
ncbi:MAG: hypothetical protein H5U40_16975 [Polyangiaceae bacterium]|nr:hypothetical protein [Polyangiaceae bacterium]